MCGIPPGKEWCQMNIDDFFENAAIAVLLLACFFVAAIAAIINKVLIAAVIMGIVAIVLLLLAWVAYRDARARIRARQKPFTTTDDTH